jgi:Cof subfamily protein (haloacid dehalogenase superfamily)
MKTIQALVLDVDGVLVGSVRDFNFPHPHPDVISALRKINSTGTKISLCTARPSFSTFKIIEGANLDNLHIANNGAEIFNHLRSEITYKTVETKIAKQIIKHFTQENFYCEVHHPGRYFIESKQNNDLAKNLAEVRRQNPELVEDLEATIQENNILRLLIAYEKKQKSELEQALKLFGDSISAHVSTAPAAGAGEFMIITGKDVSKESGLFEIAKSLNVSLENMLGVGDGINDWEFMKHCGFKATLENAHKEVLELIKNEPNSFVGKSVDENGILDIFEYFKLL